MVLKFVANFEIILFTIIFLSQYETNVIELFNAYSYDIYAGNDVSEY